MATLAPRVVVVHRRSELDELLARHGSRGQADFFLRSRGQDIGEVDDRHTALTSALQQVSAAIPLDWRRATVERHDVDRFAFESDDIVAVVGQDGLVANVAKSLAGQLVIGFDPEPRRNPGVLVQHRPTDAEQLLRDGRAGRLSIQRRSMVRAATDDGQTLTALNEIFVGHPSHQSARYELLVGGRAERHSSSGLIVGTGTGATGWLCSVHRDHRSELRLPGAGDPWLAWFVREAWPSPVTGTELVEGLLEATDILGLRALADGLVVFGDGIESDRLMLAYGQRMTIELASQALRLAIAS